jgi:hypothetical protein
MARKGMLSTALLALSALAGCGGSDSQSSGDKTSETRQQASSGSASCVESWNAASKDVRAQGSLSHRGDDGVPDVLVGTYKGAAFKETGNYYDTSGSPTTADVSVAPGDCAAVDLTSSDTETNWVMVAPKASGGGKAWYFLDATGTHPLAKPPQPLDGQKAVNIKGFGVDAKLTP